MGCLLSYCLIVKDDSQNIIEDDPNSASSFQSCDFSFPKPRPPKPERHSIANGQCYSFVGSPGSRTNVDRRLAKSFHQNKLNSREKKQCDLQCISEVKLIAKENLTKEDIKGWQDQSLGFERLMSNSIGKTIFGMFLKSEYSCENLMFWNACNILKDVQDEDEFQENVEIVFKTFLEPSSLHEVSLDFKVKEKLDKDRGETAPRTIFDEAQIKIYSLMHRDSFPRFLLSETYRQLVKVKKENPESISQEDPEEENEEEEEEDEEVEENEDDVPEIQNHTIKERKISRVSYGNRLHFESLDNECHKLLHLSQAPSPTTIRAR